MAYKRKTIDTWQIWVFYSSTYGWEHDTTELTRKDATRTKKEYIESCCYPVKIVKKREKIEG